MFIDIAIKDKKNIPGVGSYLNREKSFEQLSRPLSSLARKRWQYINLICYYYIRMNQSVNVIFEIIENITHMWFVDNDKYRHGHEFEEQHKDIC